MYIALFSVSRTNQEREDATWRSFFWGLDTHLLSIRFPPSKDLVNRSGKPVAPSVVTTPILKPFEETSALLSVNWKSGQEVLYPYVWRRQFLKGSDNAYAWVWLGYSEFYCLMDGVHFRLNGYLKKIGGGGLVQWKWGSNLPRLCKTKKC